jgi:hypothetical protein
MSMVLMYVRVGQGNPGALTVLRKLSENHSDDWMRKLCSAMIETVSSGYCLWLIFKDECDYDIHKTHAMLEKWMNEGKYGLNEWIKTNCPDSAKYVID